MSDLDLIYREISKTFQYILFHYDLLKKLMIANAEEKRMNANWQEGEPEEESKKGLEEEGIARAKNAKGDDFILLGEDELIETLISLGKATTDTKTMLNAATSLAHMTEVLHCNEKVASREAIEFMLIMLKDTKNIKNHRQGCRYFSNLSFYEKYINRLLKKKITAYMLSAIEMDTLHSSTDDDTIKYSVIALANLSCKKRFMNDRVNKTTEKSAKGSGGMGAD